jgi:hypothetical protein
MPHETPIEWADYASNAIFAVHKTTKKRGWFCIKVNGDCKFCYSEDLNMTPGPRGGTGLHFSEAELDKVDIVLSENELEAIRTLNRSGRIKSKNGLDRPTCFMLDMSDIGGNWVPKHYRDLIFDACESNTNIYWMFLTKRPEPCATACTNAGLGRNRLSTSGSVLAPAARTMSMRCCRHYSRPMRLAYSGAMNPYSVPSMRLDIYRGSAS